MSGLTELKHGCECLENDPHIGLPKTAITPKIVKKTHRYGYAWSLIKGIQNC